MSYIIKYNLDAIGAGEYITVGEGEGIVIPYAEFGIQTTKLIKILVQALPGFVRDAPFTMKVESDDIRAIVEASGELIGNAVWGADASADIGVDEGDGLTILAEVRRTLDGQEVVLTSALGFPSTGYYAPEFDATTVWYVTDANNVPTGRAGLDYARFIDIVDISAQRWRNATNVMSGSTGGIDLRLHLYTAAAGALVTDLGYSDIHNVAMTDDKTLTFAFDVGASDIPLAAGEAFAAHLENRFFGGNWATPSEVYVAPESDGTMAVASGAHTLTMPARGANNSGDMYVQVSQGGMTAPFSAGLFTTV